jgi:hypothetical protein
MFKQKHVAIVQRTQMLHNVTMLTDNTLPTYAMKEREINKYAKVSTGTV